ncbi:hypothetical protein [Nesterenkonia populi]|nr:hypothetical protein [Nesterenkonia populi]
MTPIPLPAGLLDTRAAILDCLDAVEDHLRTDDVPVTGRTP